MAEEVRNIKAIIMVDTNKRSIQETVVGNTLGELRSNINETIQDLAETIGA